MEIEECLKICWSVPRDQMVGAGPFLWMGTVRLLQSPPWIQGGATVRTTAEVTAKKKELTKPIQSGVGVGGMGYLQITNIDVLQGADCLTMCKKSTLVPHTQVLVRGINSTKVMDLDKQVDWDSNSFSEKYSLTFTLIVSILPLLLLQCLFSSCVPVLPFSL